MRRLDLRQGFRALDRDQGRLPLSPRPHRPKGFPRPFGPSTKPYSAIEAPERPNSILRGVAQVERTAPTQAIMVRMSMRDIRAREALSNHMRRIRKTNTKPELVVRRIAHRMGYRYRLHRADLPGTPDLVFPRLLKIILVHGCFWHQHDCRLGRKQPSTNTDYWLPKLARNVERDREAHAKLVEMGWDVLTIWECETRASDDLDHRIASFLSL